MRDGNFYHCVGSGLGNPSRPEFFCGEWWMRVWQRNRTTPSQIPLEFPPPLQWSGIGSSRCEMMKGVHTLEGPVASSRLSHHSKESITFPGNSNPKVHRKKSVVKIPLHWRGAKNSLNFWWGGLRRFRDCGIESTSHH